MSGQNVSTALCPKAYIDSGMPFGVINLLEHTLISHVLSLSSILFAADTSGGGGLIGLLSAHIYHVFIWIHVPLAARPLEGLEVGISRWGQRFSPPCETWVSYYTPKMHTYRHAHINVCAKYVIGRSAHTVHTHRRHTYRQPRNSDIQYAEYLND